MPKDNFIEEVLGKVVILCGKSGIEYVCKV